MKACARGMGVTLAAVLGLLIAATAWGAPYVPILIGDTQFDPKCAVPPEVQQVRIAAATAGSTISSDRGYYLVQFQGPVKAAWKRRATALGAEFVDYVPRYTFTTRMTASAASVVASQSFVRWVGPFAPQWKYRKSLVATQRAPVLRVTLFPGETFKNVAQFMGQRNLRYLDFHWGVRPGLRLRMPTGAVPDLAALPEVAWIEEYHQPQLLNDRGQRYLNVSNVAGIPGGVDVWRNSRLFGTGQIVGIGDTGLDTGNTANLHPDFLNAGGQPRLLTAFALGRPGDWSDSLAFSDPGLPSGHGTHVAGSVLGNGAMSGGNPVTADYTGHLAGIAPEASLVFQSLMDATGGFGGLPDDWGEFFQQAYDAGARIHTNSWGSSSYFGEYSSWSEMVDSFLWQHPDMTILYAAGNSGSDDDLNGVIDPDSIGQPATAKNCITVGATESYRPPNAGWGGYANYTWSYLWFWYAADPIASDYPSNNARGMAAFSSRGPCVDGRIKPDVVAPGTNIISARSRGRRGDYSGVGELWGIYDAWYLYSGGTSMATPLTAGATALVREYFETLRSHPSPSGALIKATLIHGATDLAPGQYGTGATQEIRTKPDQSQGWGRPSVGATLFPQVAHPNARLTFDDSGVITDTGSATTQPVTVTTSTVNLAVTLVWTDPPAAPYAGAALVNDLDLTVVAPGGQQYHGNFGAAAGYDRVNNVERVEIPAPAGGDYTVQVAGFNIATGPQPYALVITANTGALTTYSISGRVLDTRANPVADVPVTAEEVGGAPPRSATVLTAADGTYVIPDLAPAEYRVTPVSPDYSFEPTEQLVTITNADASGVNFTATALGLPMQIGGFISDTSGRPVPGIAVSLINSETKATLATTVTDSVGSYRFRDLRLGAYTVTPASVFGYYMSPASRDLTLPSAESNVQNFLLLPYFYGSIDVYVLGPSNNPIYNAMALVQRSSDRGATWTTVQTRATNSQGFARLGGRDAQGRMILVDGYRYRISVSKAGYVFQVTPFESYVEGPLPTAPMSPSGTSVGAYQAAFYFWGAPSPGPTYNASGLVRTLWDRAVPGVRVTYTGQSTGKVFSTVTLSNGFYYLTRMPADLYAVEVAKTGWQLDPVNPYDGKVDATYNQWVKVGPPAYSFEPSLVLASANLMWNFGFSYREAFQYANGRQDYWGMPN